MNAREARILSLEARIYRLPGLVSGLELRAATAEQRQRALWMWGGQATPDLRVSATGLAGATVEVWAGTTLVAVGTTDGSGDAYFSLPTGTYDIGIHAAGHDAVQQGRLPGWFVTPGSLTSVSQVLPTGNFSFPAIGGARTLVDPAYGTLALAFGSFSGGVGTWTLSGTVNYTGACSGCAAVSGVPTTWTLQSVNGGTSTFSVVYKDVGGGNNCPATTGSIRTLSLARAATSLAEVHFTVGASASPFYCSTGTMIVK